GYVLCLGGYMNVWPLFGAANQLLCALVLIAMTVFLKVTGRKGWMLYVPMLGMFAVTLTALWQSLLGSVNKLVNGGFVFMIDGLQLLLALALLFLALSVAVNCTRRLTARETVLAPETEEL
ncbi:MAG: carbon starvation CstA family protein, partial [Selenomonadaceae bacterium]